MKPAIQYCSRKKPNANNKNKQTVSTLGKPVVTACRSAMESSLSPLDFYKTESAKGENSHNEVLAW